jgi:hypothetical protein
MRIGGCLYFVDYIVPITRPADPDCISEFIAVNPAKAQVVTQSRVGGNVALYRAPGLGEDADAWWYYPESEGKPEVIDPENPDPKVPDTLHMGEEEFRQILDFYLRETTEKDGGTAGIVSNGSGTTGKIALEFGRTAMLIELSSAYVQLIKQRTMVTIEMF